MDHDEGIGGADQGRPSISISIASRARLVAHFRPIVGEAAAPALAAAVLASVGATLAALRAARARGDAGSTKTALHKMRGALLNGGLTAEADAAHALEIGDAGDAWARAADAFEIAIEALLDER